MTISLSDLRGNTKMTPPRMLVYGTHGVGKTSLAAGAPDPVFIQTEDGLGIIDAPSFGVLKSLDSVMEAIAALYEEEHDRKTVILDSLDWLEPLIWTAACKDNGWASIEQAGYGKGYVAALDHWRGVLDGLNALRDDKGMGIMLIAHADVKRFDSPETEPYDRYVIKLHQRAAALVQEHVDCVFFANYRVTTVKTDLGFNKKAVRAVGSGERLLFTNERPAFLAKNRYGLPDQVELNWDVLAKHLPFYAMTNTQQETQNG